MPKLSTELTRVIMDPMELAQATLDTDHKILGVIAARYGQIWLEMDEYDTVDEKEAELRWKWHRRELEHVLKPWATIHQSRLRSPVG